VLPFSTDRHKNDEISQKFQHHPKIHALAEDMKIRSSPKSYYLLSTFSKLPSEAPIFRKFFIPDSSENLDFMESMDFKRISYRL
jgi:hypothetical protein